MVSRNGFPECAHARGSKVVVGGDKTAIKDRGEGPLRAAQHA